VNDVKRYQITLKLHEMYCKKCRRIEGCIKVHKSFKQTVQNRAEIWKSFTPENSDEDERQSYQRCFSAFNGGAK